MVRERCTVRSTDKLLYAMVETCVTELLRLLQICSQAFAPIGLHQLQCYHCFIGNQRHDFRRECNTSRTSPSVILLASCGHMSVELKLRLACKLPPYELQACGVLGGHHCSCKTSCKLPDSPTMCITRLDHTQQRVLPEGCLRRCCTSRGGASHRVAGIVGVAARLARPLGAVTNAQGQAERPRGLTCA